MDGYPSSAWERNVPLLVASGLQTESSEAGTGPEVAEPGVQLLSKIPPLHGNEAQVLRDFFEDIDKQNTSWSSVDRGASYHFRIKTVGRVREGSLKFPAVSTILIILIVIYLALAPRKIA